MLFAFTYVCLFACPLHFPEPEVQNGHQQGSDHTDHQGSDQKKEILQMNDDRLASAVDTALSSFDINFDGYVEYYEYKIQKKLFNDQPS